LSAEKLGLAVDIAASTAPDILLDLSSGRQLREKPTLSSNPGTTATALFLVENTSNDEDSAPPNDLVGLVGMCDGLLRSFVVLLCNGA
jgi:hypothetical protein